MILRIPLSSTTKLLNSLNYAAGTAPDLSEEFSKLA